MFGIIVDLVTAQVTPKNERLQRLAFSPVTASAVHCSVVEGDKTKVEWRMAGDMDIPVFGGYLVHSMDAAAGPIFERGLEKLKGTVEDVNR